MFVVWVESDCFYKTVERLADVIELEIACCGFSSMKFFKINLQYETRNSYIGVGVGVVEAFRARLDKLTIDRRRSKMKR